MPPTLRQLKTKSTSRKRKDAPASLPSYASLSHLSAEKVTAWFRAPATSDAYKRYVREGKEWVTKWAEGMDEPEDVIQGLGEGLVGDELASAFDVIREATPKALHAFVVYKCVIMENSYKTAEGIHSAFKNYFT